MPRICHLQETRRSAYHVRCHHLPRSECSAQSAQPRQALTSVCALPLPLAKVSCCGSWTTSREVYPRGMCGVHASLWAGRCASIARLSALCRCVSAGCCCWCGSALPLSVSTWACYIVSKSGPGRLSLMVISCCLRRVLPGWKAQCTRTRQRTRTVWTCA